MVLPVASAFIADIAAKFAAEHMTVCYHSHATLAIPCTLLPTWCVDFAADVFCTAVMKITAALCTVCIPGVLPLQLTIFTVARMQIHIHPYADLTVMRMVLAAANDISQRGPIPRHLANQQSCQT